MTQPPRTHILEDGGTTVAVLDIGAALHDWRVAHRGAHRPVILGYRDPARYLRPAHFLGAVVGRVANRIGGAAFSLDGERFALDANDGPNQLHGGTMGLDRIRWEMTPRGRKALTLTHVSPDGANGFPGALRLRIDMALDGHRLTWDLQAEADRPTPVSLAQHAYYNLQATPDIGGHVARVAADRALVRDAAGIMTGEIAEVTGTPLDLRAGHRWEGRPGAADLVDDFVLFEERRDPDAPVAEVLGADGLRLAMWSDQPGAQVYTGQWLPEDDAPAQGPRIAPCAGFCIEPSGYPNAVNVPAFPPVIVTPDAPYRQRLSVEIAPAD